MSSATPSAQTMPAPPTIPTSALGLAYTPSRNGSRLAITTATRIPANIAMPPRRGVGIAWTSRSRTAVMAPQRSAHQRASGVVR